MVINNNNSILLGDIMLDTPEKLKEFINWCKNNKVKAFSNNEIQFELSELAFIPQTESLEEINLEDSKTFSDNSSMTEEEYDEAMYWSSTKG